MSNKSINNYLAQATCAVLIDDEIVATAWLVSNEGHLLTAGHVLMQDTPLTEVTVQFSDQINRIASQIKWGFQQEKGIDFAVLKLPEMPQNCQRLPISLAQSVEGKLRLRGYGEALGDPATGMGEFVGVVDRQNSSDYRLFRLRSDELVDEGFSGGAVYSDELKAVVAIQIEVGRSRIGPLSKTVLAMPLYRIDKYWKLPAAPPLGPWLPPWVVNLRDFLQNSLEEHRYRSFTWGSRHVGHDFSLESIYVEQNLYPFDPESSNNTSEAKASGPLLPVSIGQASAGQFHLVILGEPGSGKSTLLRWQALHLATQFKVEDSGQTKGYLPLFVPLRDYFEVEPNRSRKAGPEHLLNYIAQQVPRDVLEKLMTRGQVAFFFDGWDEIANQSVRMQVLRDIEELANWPRLKQQKPCPIVLTSRLIPYQKASKKLDERFKTYRITSFDIADQDTFIERWINALQQASGLNPDWAQQRSQNLKEELQRREGVRQALRNPLLLRMTVTLYAEWEELFGLGERYDRYIDLMLRGRDIAGQRQEPVWSDQKQAKSSLADLAWRYQNKSGNLTMLDGIKLLSESADLTKMESRLFLIRMRNAGLIHIREVKNGTLLDEGQSRLALGPHQTFQDYLVGRYFWQNWQNDRIRAQNSLFERAKQPDWQPAVLFCFGLLGRQHAWRMLIKEFKKRPLWAVRCLHEGLELTYAELTAREKRQIFKVLERRCKRVLYPSIWELITLILRRYLPQETVITAQNREHEALRVLGMLKAEEVGPILLEAALKRQRVYGQDTLIMLGPKILWPEIKQLFYYEELGWRAARIISAWREPEAFDALKWLLEDVKAHPYLPLTGLARLGSPESEELFLKALNDAELGSMALQVGLEQFKPNLIERAISAIEAGQMSVYPTRDFVMYLTTQPFEEAVVAMERLLSKQWEYSDLKDIFEYPDPPFTLPLLRLLVPLLQHPDERIVKQADKAAFHVCKGENLEPLQPNTQPVLESLLLYAEPDTRIYPNKLLQATTLSDEACEILLERLNQMNFLDSDEWDKIDIMQQLPPISEVSRQKLVAKLKSQYFRLQNMPESNFILSLIGKIGRHDEAVPIIQKLLIDNPGNFSLVNKLIEIRAPEALPYVLQRLDYNNAFRTRDALLALGQIGPSLPPTEQQQVIEVLRKELSMPDLQTSLDGIHWQARMAAVKALGQLAANEAIPDILALLYEGEFSEETAVVGLALAKMTWDNHLLEQLKEAFASRNGHVCGAVIHAWGFSGYLPASVPLFQSLKHKDNYLQKAGNPLREKHLDEVMRGLRARMAISLARLVATVAKKQFDYDLNAGWQAVIQGLDGQSTFEQTIYTVLQTAIEHPFPARLLFERMVQAQGHTAIVFGLLVGAYEWSEVLLLLARRDELDDLTTWQKLNDLFDNLRGVNSTEEQERNVPQLQKELAQRLEWEGEKLPFTTLISLQHNRTYALQGLVSDFRHEIRKWKEFLEWEKRFLAYPK